MEEQFRSWKRLRHEDGAASPAAVLREGVRFRMSALPPERVRAAMAALTFQPRGFADAPPPPVQCYAAEGDELVVPRCFPGAPSGAEDRLASGEALPEALRCSAELNELQQAAAQATLARLRAAPHAAILTLPCGFGKTVLALHVARELGRRTLVVVHKDSLLRQWLARIASFWPGARTGVLQQGRAEFEGVDVAVAMLQTLCARDMPPGCLESFGTVVLDEAHHLGARYFSQLFFRLPCRHVLGLTATPDRKDGCTQILHLFMGPFSFVLKTRSQDGVVVLRRPWPADARAGETTRLETVRLKTRLVRDARRNAFLAAACREAADAGRCVLCLSERLEHLRELRRLFEAQAGAPACAFYVGGKAAAAERAAAEATARVVFGSFAMASEGLDIPRLDTLVLASPAGDVAQAVGRVLRPCETKRPPVVLDVQDDGCAVFLRLCKMRDALYRRSAFESRECAPGDTLFD